MWVGGQHWREGLVRLLGSEEDGKAQVRGTTPGLMTEDRTRAHGDGESERTQLDGRGKGEKWTKYGPGISAQWYNW